MTIINTVFAFMFTLAPQWQLNVIETSTRCMAQTQKCLFPTCETRENIKIATTITAHKKITKQ